MIVQPRDRQLLAKIGLLRIVDREQVKVLAGFTSTTRANARLLKLTHAGLLRRFFIGTNAVGRKALYTLSPRGVTLVGASHPGIRRSPDEFLIADFFVYHQLKINEIYCMLKYRPIPIASTTFVQWLSFNEPLAQNTALVPDGFIKLSVGDQPLCAFLEVDLGNETRAVWQGKVKGYFQYSMSADFERQFHDRQFRVLVIANSARRVASLRTATANITDKIFWFTDFEIIAREGFWSAIWQRPSDEHRQPLIQP